MPVWQANRGRATRERRRTALNEAMARAFDTEAGGLDLIVTATKPDVALATDGPLPWVLGGIEGVPRSTAASGSPRTCTAIRRPRFPAGFVDGLPIGLQIVGSHFSEELLLDLALTVERNRPWPLTTRTTTDTEVMS